MASLFDGETYYSKKKRKFHFFYGTLERPLPFRQAQSSALIPSQEGKLNPPNSKETFTVFIENQLLRGFPLRREEKAMLSKTKR